MYLQHFRLALDTSVLHLLMRIRGTLCGLDAEHEQGGGAMHDEKKKKLSWKVGCAAAVWYLTL